MGLIFPHPWLLLTAASGAAASPSAAFGSSGRVGEGVLVTGATGRTGSLLYHHLKESHEGEVRAYVRNVTKARHLLHCDKCDESEGIYVGGVNNTAALSRAAKGTGAGAQ